MGTGLTVATIVAGHLCTGCGTCVVVCRQQAITIVELMPGYLSAHVDQAMCNKCSICLDVCPRSQLYALESMKCKDRFRGPVLKAFIGHATDQTVRTAAQSGGVVTALLSWQMQSNQIDKALVCRMPKDGTLRPLPFLASSQKELMSSQGSLYCPVALNSRLLDVQRDDRITMVGTGCHIDGVKNLLHKIPLWGGGVALTIGLICDRVLHFSAVDYLIHKAGVKRKDVVHFRYKDKRKGVFPGNITITLNDGNVLELPCRYRLECKDVFTPIHCRLCFNKFNILSDIVLGDAWGIAEDGVGHSVLLARTDRAIHVLHDAVSEKVLELEEIDPEKIFDGQVIAKRRNDFTAFALASQAAGYALPPFFQALGVQDELTSKSDVRRATKELRWAQKMKCEKNVLGVVRLTSKRLFREKINKQFKRFTPKRIMKSLFRRIGL